MTTYSIATVSHKIATQWYSLQKEYYRSIERFGIEPITINYNNIDPWNGFTKKPKWLYKAITEGVIKGDYLIFSDSWDLVFAAHPNEIMTRYFTFGTDIVINAEKNCFPAHFKDQFDEIKAPTDYKYLNSGFIVGKTESILKCLEEMDLPNMPGDYWDEQKCCAVHPEDQTAWANIFLKQPVSIALDYYCGLSQTLHEANMDDFDFSEERIKNKVTGAYPCVFHLNGSAKDKDHIRKPILEKLNLL